MDQRLPRSRTSAVAMLIPESLANCGTEVSQGTPDTVPTTTTSTTAESEVLTLENAFLLITTGNTQSGPTYTYKDTSSDLVYLGSDSSIQCSSYMSFPESIASGTGAVVNEDSPVICGGFSVTYWGHSPRCYILKPGHDQPFELMSVRGTEMASYATDDGRLWVTGGWSQNSYLHIETDFLNIMTGTVEAGPNMPYAAKDHCIARVSSSEAMMTEYDTWFFNFETSSFSTAPQRLSTRNGHACGHLMDMTSGHLAVVVAAGTDSQLQVTYAIIFL